ncbi:uncharacterized protein DS421_18g607220 [Arachis hypogaea]|nr:uncharacterized protein DS421_18g607220 [Arachis hypogaea]
MVYDREAIRLRDPHAQSNFLKPLRRKNMNKFLIPTIRRTCLLLLLPLGHFCSSISYDGSGSKVLGEDQSEFRDKSPSSYFLDETCQFHFIFSDSNFSDATIEQSIELCNLDLNDYFFNYTPN